MTLTFKLNFVAVAVALAVALGGAEGAIGLPEGFGLHCFKPCVLNFAPVCGTDGAAVRTFASGCDLLGYNCWHRKAYQALKIGECDGSEDPIIREPSACPQTWEPACGAEAQEVKTFPNMCLLHAYNKNNLRSQFSLMTSGQCTEAISKKQEQRNCFGCTKIYLPVCAKEGDQLVTFPNECVMRDYNCFDSRSYIVAKEGEC